MIATASTDIDQARQHIERLRHRLPANLLTCLWSKEDGSRYLACTDDLGPLDRCDRYIGIGGVTEETARKIRKNRGKHARPREDEIAYLPGLAIDLDVVGTPDGKGGVKQTGAPTLDAALEAARLLLDPTLIVLSGGGVQPWCLFDEPWLLETDADRVEAKRLMLQWQQAHRDRAGFPIDSTHDLARLYRLAGTLNYKGVQ